MELVRVKYLRKTNKKPYGVMICFKGDNDELKFGWSLCSKCDTFNKKTAISLALNRQPLFDNVPQSIIKQYNEFVDYQLNYKSVKIYN